MPHHEDDDFAQDTSTINRERNVKDRNEKAWELIKSYKQDGVYREDTDQLLTECMLMADDEEAYAIAIIALYKFVIENVRP